MNMSGFSTRTDRGVGKLPSDVLNVLPDVLKHAVHGIEDEWDSRGRVVSWAQRAVLNEGYMHGKDTLRANVHILTPAVREYLTWFFML
jgi:hypothetical protein